jgi:hypothetical protein
MLEKEDDNACADGVCKLWEYDMSKNNTTVAIVYDFDGTLAKGIQNNPL